MDDIREFISDFIIYSRILIDNNIRIFFGAMNWNDFLVHKQCNIIIDDFRAKKSNVFCCSCCFCCEKSVVPKTNEKWIMFEATYILFVFGLFLDAINIQNVFSVKTKSKMINEKPFSTTTKKWSDFVFFVAYNNHNNNSQFFFSPFLYQSLCFVVCYLLFMVTFGIDIVVG